MRESLRPGGTDAVELSDASVSFGTATPAEPMTGRARGGLFGLTALLVAGVCFYDPLLRWAFSAVAAWFRQGAYGPTPVRSLTLPPATLARMLAFVWVHPVETGAWVVIACSITGGVLTHLAMRRRFPQVATNSRTRAQIASFEFAARDATD